MKITEFFIDAIRTFLFFALTALFSITNFIADIIGTLVRFTKNFLIPQLTELLADTNLLLKIMQQTVYSTFSSVSLYLSKAFYNMSKHYHNKSENLINETWEFR